MHVTKGAVEVSTKYGTFHVTPETALEFQAVTGDNEPVTIFGIPYQLRVHIEWRSSEGNRVAGWYVEHIWSDRQDREWVHQGKHDLTDAARRIIRRGDLGDALVEHVTKRAEDGEHWGAETERVKHKIGVLQDEYQKLACQIESLGYAKRDAEQKARGGSASNRHHYTCKCERYDHGGRKHQNPDVERCVRCCLG